MTVTLDTRTILISPPTSPASERRTFFMRNKFAMSPRAQITTGIIYFFIPHILVVSVSRSLYLESFLVFFNEVFLSDGTSIFISSQVCSYGL